MFAPTRNENELAAFGLVASDFDDGGTTEIWPENVVAFQVFDAMTTQWRVGAAGPTGLDYAALPVVWRTLGVRRPDQRDVFDSVGVMERAALRVMARARE